MFGKLLKYEWRASKRLLGLLTLAALGAGVLGTVLVRLMTVAESVLEEDAVMVVGVSVLVVGIGFLALTLVAYVIATQIWLAVRFYKNKYTDEGYLTFTLPVNSHEIFLSSLVNYILWTVISALTVIAAVLMVFVFGFAEEGLFNTEGMRTLQTFLGSIEEFAGEQVALRAVLRVLQVLTGLVSAPVIVMTSITLGAVVAKKHKIVAAVGIYYGINMVTSTLTTMVTTAVSVSSVMAGTAFDAETYSMGILVGQLLLQTGLAVGGYFVSTALMRKKLNLP